MYRSVFVEHTHTCTHAVLIWKHTNPWWYLVDAYILVEEWKVISIKISYVRQRNKKEVRLSDRFVVNSVKTELIHILSALLFCHWQKQSCNVDEAVAFSIIQLCFALRVLLWWSWATLQWVTKSQQPSGYVSGRITLLCKTEFHIRRKVTSHPTYFVT